jgi:hypothetical protein
MLIRDGDDERTLIDRRFSALDSLSDTTAFFVDPARLSAPEPPFEGSGRAVSPADGSPRLDEVSEETPSWWYDLCAKLSGRRRGMIETGVVLSLVLGLGSVAYQQWRAAVALRETIDDMKTAGSAPLVQDPVASVGRGLAPAGTEAKLKSPAREVAAGEREALEHRGATLIGSNNFVDALTHYQVLTELFPNEAAFRDLVIVLRAKLRCVDPVDPSSRACQ